MNIKGSRCKMQTADATAQGLQRLPYHELCITDVRKTADGLWLRWNSTSESVNYYNVLVKNTLGQWTVVNDKPIPSDQQNYTVTDFLQGGQYRLRLEAVTNYTQPIIGNEVLVKIDTNKNYKAVQNIVCGGILTSFLMSLLIILL